MDKLIQTKKQYYKRNIKLKKLGYNNYNEYLNSEHWKNKRKAKKLSNCICGSNVRLELHHKTYKRVGQERLSDLVWLCHDCHEKAHVLINEGKTTLWESVKEVKTKKNKRRKRKKDKTVIVSSVHIVSSSYLSSYKGVKVQRYRLSKKQREHLNHRAEQVNLIHKKNIASQKYKQAFKSWLAGRDYSLPKPKLEDFM